jgi:hypothetical protein
MQPTDGRQTTSLAPRASDLNHAAAVSLLLRLAELVPVQG